MSVNPNTSAIRQERIRFPNLPLAVYREIAAHLQQVTEVKTRLISQSAKEFDYTLSQIEALEVSYPSHLPATEKQLLTSILSYYAQRYGDYTLSQLN